jgi:hypothetical protein
MAGSAWQGAAKEARPNTTARDSRPRRRTRGAQSCGACPALDADLEEVRRAGRDAELEEFSRAPGRAHSRRARREAQGRKRMARSARQEALAEAHGWKRMARSARQEAHGRRRMAGSAWQGAHGSKRMAGSAWHEAQGRKRKAGSTSARRGPRRCGHAGAAREGAARGAAFLYLYM